MRFDKGREVFGGDEEPVVLRMAIRDGRVTWTHETVRDARKEKVRELANAGVAAKDIAKELGVSEARISQIKKKLHAEENVVPFSRPRSPRYVTAV